MQTLQTIQALKHDLGGGLQVRRLLPSAQRQAVGPFLFFDHFGPVYAKPGDQHDVRPHPHIGLSTVTYLFEGAIMHRDSTGVVQRMEPGQLNWMTAGKGIVHSERTPQDLLNQTRTLHGLQLWIALPAEQEECEPALAHFEAGQLPKQVLPGVQVTVIAGSAFGLTSPAPTHSPTVYLDIQMESGSSLALPADYSERALYLLDEGCTLDGTALPAHSMVLLPAGSTPQLQADRQSRLVMIGGEPLGHRHMVWNFVSSRRERIAQARDDWMAGRFPVVQGETEFIPFPAAKA